MAEVENGIKLTKTIVDKLEHIPGKTQTFYRDNDCLRVNGTQEPE